MSLQITTWECYTDAPRFQMYVDSNENVLSIEIFFVILLSHRRDYLEIKLILFFDYYKDKEFLYFTSFSSPFYF